MPTAGGVDRSHLPSREPKLAFAALHAAALAGGGWFAFGGALPDLARARLLFAVAALYFLRHLLTLFVLLKRRVGYGEAAGLSLFLAAMEVGFVMVGGGALRHEVVPFDWLDAVAVGLVLVGSGLNSGSELQRWAWKKDAANQGHCYTKGLFAWAMHVNYFGDTVMFTGWAMLTRSPWALILPAVMAMTFVFFHIPALDAYLADRYGDEFRAYASRTAKFVPFLY
jgi:steroid 5-alpha reductase family enzyme